MEPKFSATVEAIRMWHDIILNRMEAFQQWHQLKLDRPGNIPPIDEMMDLPARQGETPFYVNLGIVARTIHTICQMEAANLVYPARIRTVLKGDFEDWLNVLKENRFSNQLRHDGHLTRLNEIGKFLKAAVKDD